MEIDLLELAGCVSVFVLIGLFVIRTVVEYEGQIVLLLSHLHHGRIGKSEAGVALL